MLIPLIDIIFPFSVWHWIILGLIIISIEMMLGTFDLLIVAFASFVTAAFAAFLPDAINNWQTQTIIFVTISIVCVVLGRTVFKRTPGDKYEHPTLNKRMESLIGKRGVIEADFVAGTGRVQIGDTTWMAEAVDPLSPIPKGSVVEVVDVNNTIVRIKLA